MILKQGRQIIVDELSGNKIDLFLCAGNHEKRVFTGYDWLSKSCQLKNSYAFCYKSDFETGGRDNISKLTISDIAEIHGLLDREISTLPKGDSKIIVDYSCMTKSWYYAIILYLTQRKIEKKSILVYFLYTPSKYAEPLEPKPNTEIGPLPGKYIVPTDKPKALIVCLGYEISKAEGIIDHLDPKKYFIFYSKPALDKKFVATVEKNNHGIIEGQNVINFPLDNLLVLEKRINICLLSFER